MATRLRRATAALLTTALTCLLTAAGLLVASAPASAEDGYRYWNYYHLTDGSWAFSQVGPADHQPKDGDVEGFRYGAATPKQPIMPRADLDEVGFEQVCAGTDKAAGEKRVAVLIDYGTPQDAEDGATPPEPRADCATVPADASTQDVLADVADVRVEGGMTCALDGYPASGCGVPVKDVQVPANEKPVGFALPETAQQDGQQDSQDNQDEDGSNGALLAAVAAAVVVLGGGGYLFSRRNSG